jgi:hypothetical protein
MRSNRERVLILTVTARLRKGLNAHHWDTFRKSYFASGSGHSPVSCHTS